MPIKPPARARANTKGKDQKKVDVKAKVEPILKTKVQAKAKAEPILKTKARAKAEPVLKAKAKAESKPTTTKLATSTRKPSYLDFDKKAYAWKPDVDYKAEPEKYRVGKGEQGVLICQPYKAALVPLWRFATPAIATESSRELTKKFLDYLADNDFVGADLTRKFLQMGFTRARRYANYKGGKKYDKEHDYEQLERGTGDPIKAESAEIFFKAWKTAEANEDYAARKVEWKEKFG